MGAAFIQFHTQDSVTGAKIAGAFLSAQSEFGPWQAVTNECGDFFTPPPGLGPGHYDVTISAKGYQDQTIPMDLGECGVVLIGLVRSGGGGGGNLPAVPTRAQVASVQHSLAGLTYHTREFGDVPAWFYGKLNAEDRAEARDQHRIAGDTHIPFPVTEAYREPGTLWPAALADGYDYTSDDGLRIWNEIAAEAISEGFFIDCPLGGDGLGSGPGYNDPVGRTYGHGWLVANLERMLRAMQSYAKGDITRYTSYRPGWDAVFYGWGGTEAQHAAQMKKMPTSLRHRHMSNAGRAHMRMSVPKVATAGLDDQQTRVRDFGQLFRAVLPDGYLAIEHTPGNIPCGEGGGDYAPGGLMTTYDTILGEYDTFHQDSYWQIAGRMLDVYHRPPDQPAGDDPNPPKYLGPDSPRGPYFYVVFEPTKNGVYEFCRGQCSRESMQQEDAYIRTSGATLTGYPTNW